MVWLVPITATSASRRGRAAGRILAPVLAVALSAGVVTPLAAGGGAGGAATAPSESALAAPGAGVVAAAGANGEDPPRVRRVFPATIAKRRLEQPKPPPPTQEEIDQQVRYKIVGGKTAKPGQIPWQVALVRSGADSLFDGYFCGGSLIAGRFVLTAAHCTYENAAQGDARELDASDIDIVLGSHDFQNGAVLKVVDITRHSFDPETYDNDIAILELASLPEISDRLQSVRLVPSQQPVYGVNVRGRVSGWGATVPGRIPPELRKKVAELQYVDVDIKDVVTCNARYLQDYRQRIFDAQIRRGFSAEKAAQIRDATAPLSTVMITANMYCAGGSRDAAQDSCSGDSGGPFVIQLVDDDGRMVHVQSGIVSWGPADGCGLIDRYGVYVRLEKYADWIAERIGR